MLTVVAWLSLGLALALIAAAVIALSTGWTRQAPAVREMSDQERFDWQAAWAQVSCGFCGCVHYGTCTRVREIRYQASGQMERVSFWRDWGPPAGALRPEEVGLVPEVKQSKVTPLRQVR